MVQLLKHLIAVESAYYVHKAIDLLKSLMTTSVYFYTFDKDTK